MSYIQTECVKNYLYGICEVGMPATAPAIVLSATYSFFENIHTFPCPVCDFWNSLNDEKVHFEIPLKNRSFIPCNRRCEFFFFYYSLNHFRFILSEISFSIEISVKSVECWMLSHHFNRNNGNENPRLFSNNIWKTSERIWWKKNEK